MWTEGEQLEEFVKTIHNFGNQIGRLIKNSPLLEKSYDKISYILSI